MLKVTAVQLAEKYMNFNDLYIVGLPTGSTDIVGKPTAWATVYGMVAQVAGFFAQLFVFAEMEENFYGDADIGKGTFRL